MLFLLDIASGKLWWGLTCWRRAFHLWRTVDIYSLGCNSAKMPGLCLSYHSHSPQWMGWFCKPVCSLLRLVPCIPPSGFLNKCLQYYWMTWLFLGRGRVVWRWRWREGDEMRAKLVPISSLLCTIRDWPLSGKGWRSLDRVRSNISTDFGTYSTRPCSKNFTQSNSLTLQSSRRRWAPISFHLSEEESEMLNWSYIYPSHSCTSSGLALPVKFVDC